MKLINIPIIILAIIILFIIIWVLISMNKKIKEKLRKIKQQQQLYLEQLNELNKLKPNETDLEITNQIARKFFKEAIKLDYNLTYLELKKIFERKNEIKLAKFCKSMSNFLYSGKKIKPIQIKKTINIFIESFREYYQKNNWEPQIKNQRFLNPLKLIKKFIKP